MFFDRFFHSTKQKGLCGVENRIDSENGLWIIKAFLALRKETAMKKQRTNENSGLCELIKTYYDTAEQIGEYIEKLKLRQKNSPEECFLIEKRIEVLKSERHDLLDTAEKLERLRLPKTRTPSLAERERESA